METSRISSMEEVNRSAREYLNSTCNLVPDRERSEQVFTVEDMLGKIQEINHLKAMVLRYQGVIAGQNKGIRRLKAKLERAESSKTTEHFVYEETRKGVRERKPWKI